MRRGIAHYKIRLRAVVATIFVVLVTQLGAGAQNVSALSVTQLQNQIQNDQAQLAVIAQQENAIEQQMVPVQQKIQELNVLLSQIASQIATVNQQLYSAQARLQSLVIQEQQVQQQLITTEHQLSQREAILNKRVRYLADISQTNIVELILTSSNIMQFIQRLMDLTYIVNSDHKLALELMAEKQKIAEYKMTLDKQKAQQQSLVSSIEAQRNLLQQQYSAQANIYNQLASLQAQLASEQANLENQASLLNSQILSDQQLIQEMINFAESRVGSGGDIVSPENYSNAWGTYYNQRDARWGDDYIGNSDVLVWEAGCLLSDIAMVATHYGYSYVNPGWVASHTSWFDAYGDMYDSAIVNAIPGHVGTIVPISSPAQVTQLVLQHAPVIVGMQLGGGETHFVTLIGMNGSNDWLMNDPWPEYGYDLSFDAYYDPYSIYVAIYYS